ncbi:MarR family winged helix-turn-helix transcriptional regulator [Parafrigoribacterium soli]|uniref:MarR family winged helix-turn-helix transcriptional regulator n=1 Tax=Parafrigoribacterium soli TaxID=3144663 RepID=UPI0032ED216A
MAAPDAGAGGGSRHTATAVRPIGFWLKLVDRLIDEQFERALADFEVTRHQWELLNILSPGPGTLTRLNHELEPFLDASAGANAAEHLAGLIDRGWVDVAFEYYELTGEGASKHAELHRVVAKNRTGALADLSEEDYATTLRSLERVARTLGWES